MRGRIMWRMTRVLLALLTFVLVLPGQVTLSLGQTPEFEGTYKGKIVVAGGAGCNLALNVDKFEQIMTISGDRVYLERKATQSNILFAGTVNSDGTVSASAISQDTSDILRNEITVLTGKIQRNDFTGSMNSRRCTWSVQMKK